VFGRIRVRTYRKIFGAIVGDRLSEQMVFTGTRSGIHSQTTAERREERGERREVVMVV
jgi:hypothetical protein